MRRVLAALCLSAVLAACSSDSNGSTDNPVEACNSFSSAVCNRFFACDATAAANVYGNVTACISDVSAQASCSTASCPTGKTFNSSQAQTCLNDLTNQSCPDNANSTLPTSCTTICQ
jgi:hypothetical protein